MPDAIPSKNGMINFLFFTNFFMFNVMASTNLSYTLKTTINVPPETPGITFAIPIKIPIINVLIISIISKL